MERNYGGVIWTNHALKRLKERGIKQRDAWAVWRNPDESRYSKADGGWIYSKKWGDQKIEVVAKQNEKKEWLILSVWPRQMYTRYKKGKERSFIQTVWRLIRRLFS
jgi:hypothetical protein